MVYNLTGISNSTTDMLSFTQLVNNEIMGGFLGIMLLVGIGAVLFIGFYRASTSAGKSMAATSFIIMILGILFRAVDLVDDVALFGVIVVAALMIAVTWKSD